MSVPSTDPELDLRRWREAFRGGADSASAELDSETLAALALGELSGEERARVADRVLADPQALADYRTLVELHRAAGGPVAAPQAAEAPHAGERPGWRRWAGLAAAACALVVAGLWVGTRPDSGSVVPPPPEVLRGGESAVEPASGALLLSAPESLGWPRQAGAAGYRLILLDEAGEELWRSRSTGEAHVDLPDAVIARLAGGDFVWTVEVEGASARSRLGPFRFRVSPPGE